MKKKVLHPQPNDAHSTTMPLPSSTFKIFFLLATFCIQPLAGDCPRLCECKWKSGKESVICHNANLTTVPNHLDRGTQVLDLTDNTISSVRDDEFSNAGLLNLQKIYLSRCKIRIFERYSFRNLINLVELDLSYNLLTAVPTHVFESITELRELRLSGNPIQRIRNEAFSAVHQLVRLELSDCKISQIESRAFAGLERSLEWLKLDDNRLAEVDASSFTILQSLHELELAGNPWNCSCSLRPLREWMLAHNVPFGVPPVCKFPKRLSSKSWDKLDLDEFACIPEIIAFDTKAHGIEGKNVTMTCRIAGIPEPTVRWLLKNRVIANLSGTTYSNGKKLYVVQLKNNASDLTILTADVQDAGVYVCAAENKAGRAEASVTLAVSRKPTETQISNRALIASVIAGILFVLVACMAVICLYSSRKNRRRWQRSDCRREDNYEKIEMNHKLSSGLNGGAPQSEISVVGRRNGDYRVVSGADTDQEEEEAALEPAKSWSKDEKRWNSPERLVDPEDLHIPRRTLKEARDDFNKNCSSTSGIYNSRHPLLSPSASSTPSQSQQFLHASGSSIQTAAYTKELVSLLEDDLEKKFPDLIENSSSTQPRTSKANSEGGSVSDITDLFCTLPRKRNMMQNPRYKSSDSQSLLLPESRYGSSGGDSSCSSSSRRLSDSHPMPNSGNKSRGGNMSNSYLNLTRPKASVLEQNLNSTPLLDVNSLENRMFFRPEVSLRSPPPVPTNVTTYDYHAAQLERFLEEYRNLQKQLKKMKETCDTLRHDKTPVDNLLQHSLPATPSDDGRKSNSMIKPTTPNSNQVLDNFELSRYLLPSNGTFNQN